MPTQLELFAETTDATDFRIMARAEHRRAELDRLNRGMEGCGCAVCQDFYQTIDLSLFGRRVKKYGDTVLVGASAVRLPPVAASKAKDEGSVTPAPQPRIMKHILRGRPPKKGKVSRTTAWRRKRQQPF